MIETPKRPPSLALVADADGGVLVLARPYAKGTHLAVLRLMAEGDSEAVTELLLPAGIVLNGLDARISGGMLGLVWSETSGTETRVRSAAVDLASGAQILHPPRAVLPKIAGEGARALLQVRTSGEINVMTAQRQGPCSSDIGNGAGCLEVSFGTLGDGSGAPPRPRLEMPSPCDQPLAAFAVLPNMWHYAVCSRVEGAPQITLFSAQPRPAYAQAQQLPLGCAASGQALLGERLWITARCGDERDHAFVVDAEGEVQTRRIGNRALRCEAGRLALQLGAEQQLLQSGDHGIEALLPREIAPDGARAAWLGDSLVVAQPGGRDAGGGAVTAPLITRYRCTHNLLSTRSFAVAAGG